MRIDVHQHVWTPPLVDALSARSSLPRVVRAQARIGVEARTTGRARPCLEIAREPPSILDLDSGTPERRVGLLDRDGIDVALIAMSSPLGIEALPRDEASHLIDAHLVGVEALGPRFAAWGPIPLDRPEADDVDRALERGCVGISLPAGALATPRRIAAIGSVLDRVADRGVPLFVHPGPAPGEGPGDRGDDLDATGPMWWAPLTGYVSQVQAAWLSFATLGRRDHPRLTLVFAMLAGVAPLLSERLQTRGGPAVGLDDPLIFYDNSSFGPVAIDAMAQLVGESQLVYGSDRPVVEPLSTPIDRGLQANAARLLSTMRARPSSPTRVLPVPPTYHPA